MKKNILKLYTCIVLICVIFLVYVYNNLNVVQFSKYENSKAIEVKEFNLQEVEENKVVLNGKIPDEVKHDCAYGFYTIHRSVKFYVDNELYYSFDKGDNPFGNTAGLAWHFVNIRSQDAGKEYYIEFNTSYDIIANDVPLIMFGERYEVFKEIIKADIVQATVCVMIGIAGITLIICWIIMRKKAKINESLLALGGFSIFFSIWSFNELKISAFLFSNHLITSNLSFIMLMLTIIPFVLFTKESLFNEDSKFCAVICYLTFVDIIISLFLQIFMNIDFRLTIWMTHIIIILFVASEIFMIAKAFLKKSITKTMKINIIGLIVLLLGIIIDMYLYYEYKNYDANIYGRGCFLIYCIMLGATLLKETSELIKKREEVAIYQRLAFSDTLTGMKNRTKFMNDINSYDNDKVYNNIQIFMLDLNDLKRYNDDMGHDVGDFYIKTAADIIKNTFQLYGDCYRIGGDEFCVIINTPIEESTIDLLKRLRDVEKDCNLNLKNIKVEIACGFAKYNSIVDKNIDDILKRADTSMYNNKRELKLGSI